MITVEQGTRQLDRYPEFFNKDTSRGMANAKRHIARATFSLDSALRSITGGHQGVSIVNDGLPSRSTSTTDPLHVDEGLIDIAHDLHQLLGFTIPHVLKVDIQNELVPLMKDDIYPKSMQLVEIGDQCIEQGIMQKRSADEHRLLLGRVILSIKSNDKGGRTYTLESQANKDRVLVVALDEQYKPHEITASTDLREHQVLYSSQVYGNPDIGPGVSNGLTYVSLDKPIEELVATTT